MKIVIIEDEMLVAEELADSLKQIQSDIEIVCILNSVKEAICYFSTHSQPDLIFSDIHLGDGLSFEILKSTTFEAPVIFCTAFDEYALEAFNANGIAYVLKPFSMVSLKNALKRYDDLKNTITSNLKLKYEVAIAALATIADRTTDTILIKYRDRLLPFSLEKIALFYIENGITYMQTHLGKTYTLSDNLEEIEKNTGSTFFRMNRQFLVNRNAVEDAVDYFPRKLKINLVFLFDKDIIVSKEKRKKLLDWLLY